MRPKHGVVLLKGSYDPKSGHHVVPALDDFGGDGEDADVEIIVLTGGADVAGRLCAPRVVSGPAVVHASRGKHSRSSARTTRTA